MQIKKYQSGGAAPAQAAPAQAGPEEQLAQMAQEIVQQLGPEAAAMLAQMIMEMVQSAQPVGQPESEQAFMRCGGKLQKKAKKACGGKMSM